LSPTDCGVAAGQPFVGHAICAAEDEVLDAVSSRAMAMV
jgi:hypothetical protein